MNLNAVLLLGLLCTCISASHVHRVHRHHKFEQQQLSRGIKQAACEEGHNLVMLTTNYRGLESSFRIGIHDNDKFVSAPLRDGGGKEMEASIKDVAALALNSLKQAFPDQQLRMLDAGANIGLYGFWLASLGYESHMFEPVPLNLERLRCTLHFNPQLQQAVHLVEAGLGDGSVTEACFSGDSNNKGSFGVRPQMGCAEKIKITSVDAYWKNTLEKQPIHVMKVDIEGYESLLFGGAGEMLTESPPLVMLVEFQPKKAAEYGHDFASLYDKLTTEWGYRVFRIEGSWVSEFKDKDSWMQMLRNAERPAFPVQLFDTIMVHNTFPGLDDLIAQLPQKATRA